MVRQVFNSLANLHGRHVTLKRFGIDDAHNIYSPVTISPSNYFRFLNGPSDITIRGREFLIPTDSMKGEQIQKLTFSVVPTAGSFTLTYLTFTTGPIAFNATASDIQTALRLLTGLTQVTVTGDFTAGFTIHMTSVATQSVLVAAQTGTPVNATMTMALTGYTTWNPIIKKGDRILDTLNGMMTIDEIIEIADFGAQSIMGYRVRCE